MRNPGASRRDFLRLGAGGLAGLFGLAAFSRGGTLSAPVAGTPAHAHGDGAAGAPHTLGAPLAQPTPPGHTAHDQTGTVGEVDTRNFDPLQFLTAFDTGTVSTLASGQ